MTNTATKTYIVGVIERAIAYYKVEAEDARTAAGNWSDGDFWDRDYDALDTQGPCNVREDRPDGSCLTVPPSEWEDEPTAATANALTFMRSTIAGEKAAHEIAPEQPARFAFAYDPKNDPDRADLLVGGRYAVAVIRTEDGLRIHVFPITGGQVWDDPFERFEVHESDVRDLEREMGHD